MKKLSDKIQYSLAYCCKPIRKDDVFGFVTTGEGLKYTVPTAPRKLYFDG
ncbi:MAG: hypothetical protein R2765_09575 [Ferruginibacter sp.]